MIFFEKGTKNIKGGVKGYHGLGNSVFLQLSLGRLFSYLFTHILIHYDEIASSIAFFFGGKKRNHHEGVKTVCTCPLINYSFDMSPEGTRCVPR